LPSTVTVTGSSRRIFAHEDDRAAIHDGHFRSVQGDPRIGDAATRQRGHEVLDRTDRKAVAIGKAGAKMRVADKIIAGRDRPGSGTRINAVENDSGVGRGRRHS
jgi:hypothetical protein